MAISCRCQTGEGVYAFKCRRAEQLFNVLQDCVQNAGHTPGDGPEGTGPAILRSATSRPASDSDPSVTPALSPSRSQPNGGVVESATATSVLYPQAGGSANRSSAQAIYMNEEAMPIIQQGPPSPKSSASSPRMHEYVNTSAVPVVMAENSDRFESAAQISRPGSQVSTGSYANGVSQQEKKNSFSGIFHNAHINGNSPLSIPQPQLSATESEAQSAATTPRRTSADLLDVATPDEVFVYEQRDSPMYVNVTPDVFRNGFHQQRDAEHCYANISVGAAGLVCSNPSPTSSVSSPGMRQQATKQVNYIVLDLARNESPCSVAGTTTVAAVAGVPGSSFSEPNSPNRRVSTSAAEGYAMIDFDKTVALSNSANPNLQDDDGSSRKTRHNSTITPASTVLP